MAEIYLNVEWGETPFQAEGWPGPPVRPEPCQYCADLSALQAPAKERRYRQRIMLAYLALIAAASIFWLIVASPLRGHPP